MFTWQAKQPQMREWNVIRGLAVQVNGFVAGYEATGLKGYGQAVLTFYKRLTEQHSYVTGGSNQGEMWGPPDNVADAVTDVRGPLPLSSQSAHQARLLVPWHCNVWQRHLLQCQVQHVVQMCIRLHAGLRAREDIYMELQACACDGDAAAGREPDA